MAAPRRKALSVAHKRLLIEAGRWALDHMPGADQKRLSAALAEIAEARTIEAERKRRGPAKGEARNATPPATLAEISRKAWAIWEGTNPTLADVFDINISLVLRQWPEGESPPSHYIANKAIQAHRAEYEAQWWRTVVPSSEQISNTDETEAAIKCLRLDIAECERKLQVIDQALGSAGDPKRRAELAADRKRARAEQQELVKERDALQRGATIPRPRSATIGGEIYEYGDPLPFKKPTQK